MLRLLHRLSGRMIYANRHEFFLHSYKQSDKYCGKVYPKSAYCRPIFPELPDSQSAIFFLNECCCFSLVYLSYCVYMFVFEFRNFCITFFVDFCQSKYKKCQKIRHNWLYSIMFWQIKKTVQLICTV